MKPATDLRPNSFDFQTRPLVKPTGFREYDARWWFGYPGSHKPPELNLLGVQALGMGLATLMAEKGVGRRIVVGHDFRSYSLSIKLALAQGLMAGGAEVLDIGLALSPMAYFAQFALDAPSVAMVTASHNENGWTGVKMGCDRPVTFGPDDMASLRDIVMSGEYRLASGGSYESVPNFRAQYLDDLTKNVTIERRLKIVCACGNGTAGAFAPPALERIGCEVVPLDCELNHDFPRYNPNPEDMGMLHAMAEAVGRHDADLALGFDGDGDRCGLVDERGREIFSDKIGVMLARDMAREQGGGQFVVDVKSTGLYQNDPVLRELGAKTDYFKTGHSYIKRRVRDLGATAGFEKSGHFFFGAPYGRGYDDGLLTAVAILRMLDRHPVARLGDLYDALPQTYGSPTMSADCADERKYEVVARTVETILAMQEQGELLSGHPIAEANTINGIRVTNDDGTWGLVRASSNKPEIVVVVESPVSEGRRHKMFEALDGILRRNEGVGDYNQLL
ncbi:phosphomannomutase/phosphoglucomutase [Notoacmeibacter ruber]|uniref:Phosphomannomutase/phosphoglucomutase n=1 Tax=Notoacmeibacter ruber TaxID=2670375 RepID=A0A3L7JCP9_9HYPH|nr:phosphomannomutase/phosphoglucomutase [Notoacmeibacter ruber]RLQ87351.1 phosphomannomutase/phosphoglucomutase [Notoacmeibacter ruber]